MRTIAALLIGLAVAHGQEKPAPAPEKITYRALGLFSPQRVDVLRIALKELPDFKLIDIDFVEAEITLEFSPQKLFPNQKPDRVTVLVNDQIRNITKGTFGVQPRRTIARDKLVRVEIPVAGCDCLGCNLVAYEAVAGVEGVMQATASFQNGRVSVLIDPAKTDRAKLEDALRKRSVDVRTPKDK